MKYGNWSKSKGELQVSETDIWQRRKDLKGQFFKLSAIKNIPYVTKVIDKCSSEKCFQGIYPDIWHTLQNIMNFTYIIISNKDNSYGTELKNGSWNGMIGKMFSFFFMYHPNKLSYILLYFHSPNYQQ